MNELDRKIERVLEGMVERLRENLHHAEELLHKFRQHHQLHHLAFIRIVVSQSRCGDEYMNLGPVSLTAGQTAIARIAYFDKNGNSMPADFKAPVTFSTDDKNGAVAKIVDNGDGTATVTPVADGTANLTAVVAGPDGELSDTAAITVSGIAPPTPVLGSIKIGFDVQ